MRAHMRASRFVVRQRSKRVSKPRVERGFLLPVVESINWWRLRLDRVLSYRLVGLFCCFGCYWIPAKKCVKILAVLFDTANSLVYKLIAAQCGN